MGVHLILGRGIAEPKLPRRGEERAVPENTGSVVRGLADVNRSGMIAAVRRRGPREAPPGLMLSRTLRVADSTLQSQSAGGRTTGRGSAEARTTSLL